MNSSLAIYAHLKAVSFSILAFTLLGVSYFGWGKASSLVLGLEKSTPESNAIPVWLGWAATLFIFQVFHFIFPITVYVVIPILLLGVLFAIPSMSNVAKQTLSHRQHYPYAIIALYITLAAYLASKAMLPPEHVDTGVYHLNSIRWINTFPIVPGLGNLHGRLAFNQSFFTYVAALNFYPYHGQGRSLANSFLLLLTIATLLPSLSDVLHKPSLLATCHPFKYVGDLLALPMLGFITLSPNWLGSPTPDLASGFLQFAMFIMLIHGIGKWIQGEREQDYSVIVLVILAATAVTIKLSNCAFSLVILGFSLYYAFYTKKRCIALITRITLSFSIIISLWCTRGVILSGAPFYPSTIGYISTEWAVPLEKVIDEAKDVYSQARLPNLYWKNVLNNWAWFKPWLIRISNDSQLVYQVFLSIFFWLCTLTSIAVSTCKKKHRAHQAEWYILTPLLASLIFWFFTAPDPRFAFAIFWLLSLSFALIFLSHLRPLVTRRQFSFATSAILLMSTFYTGIFICKHPDSLTSVSLSGWSQVAVVPLIKNTTLSNLTVFSPEIGDVCWDSPLPATPYFNPYLSLRNPMHLASGFKDTENQRRSEQ